MELKLSNAKATMRFKNKNIRHNKNVLQCVYTSNTNMEWVAINGIALLSVTMKKICFII